jgi:hypothetical protein
MDGSDFKNGIGGESTLSFRQNDHRVKVDRDKRNASLMCEDHEFAVFASGHRS